MKISTKGRYALRLMADLATYPKGETVPLRDIAERQDISIKYLEQIVSVLNKAGYVRSIRGSGGGYSLTADPKEYTVGMILRLTEGSLAPVSCLETEVNTCPRAQDCSTLFLWEKLYSAINEVVDNITIADLADNSKLFDYIGSYCI
ncbi:MAG: Rrf2 family transcriptional regulator [Oscillospiraceae bacterium]|nr:Rrf2 family transcriptional regulator [Oscillospiraceae bacterium]